MELKPKVPRLAGVGLNDQCSSAWESQCGSGEESVSVEALTATDAGDARNRRAANEKTLGAGEGGASRWLW
jgi:hypothetical protein